MVFEVGEAVGCGAGVMGCKDAGGAGLAGVVEGVTLVTALGACGASAGLDGRAIALGATTGAALAVEGVWVGKTDLVAFAFSATDLAAGLATGFDKALTAGLGTALAAGLGAALEAGLVVFAAFTSDTDRGVAWLLSSFLEAGGFNPEAVAVPEAFDLSAGLSADLAVVPAGAFTAVLVFLAGTFTSFLLWALACG